MSKYFFSVANWFINLYISSINKVCNKKTLHTINNLFNDSNYINYTGQNFSQMDIYFSHTLDFGKLFLFLFLSWTCDGNMNFTMHCNLWL